MYEFDIRRCELCPRGCGADRTAGVGLCGADDRIRIARASPHMWEEPCISGTGGSGAIFFSGCALGCVFCQNREISHFASGVEVSVDRLREICFELKEQGVHNVSLVTADHYVPLIAPMLRSIKQELGVPIVFNCSGYISAAILDMLDGAVDIYLNDLKFFSPAVSAAMAGAPDYFETAIKGLDSMLDRIGKPVIEGGIMKRGVIVRHLVLPGMRRDSIELVRYLASRYPKDAFLFSLMSQYTPNGAEGAPSRKLTTFEYESVRGEVQKTGFDGYLQERNSARPEYTPPFDLTGVIRRQL